MNQPTPDLAALRDKARLLTAHHFDEATLDTDNGLGLCGELNVTSRCGQFHVTAYLASDNPDDSDDELRSQWSLCVSVCDAHARELYGFNDMAYEYHGDTPGEHLEELFNAEDGGLLRMLFEEVFAH